MGYMAAARMYQAMVEAACKQTADDVTWTMTSGTTQLLAPASQLLIQISTRAWPQHIRRGDVLLEFNGTPIANDGTVHLRQRERIYFSYLITLLTTGQQARVKVSRGAGFIAGEVMHWTCWGPWQLCP
jgi:hypothetical protein